MHLLAAFRGVSAVLLGGTLVGFVPQIESPISIVAWQNSSSSVDGDHVQPTACAWNPPDLDQISSDDEETPVLDQDQQPRRPAVRIRLTGHESAPPKFQLAAAQNAVKGATKSKDYVKAKVFLSVDKLAAGDKCKFAVVLEVQDGWHINANPPSPEEMIPTQVTVQSKYKAKQLETTYPEGSELTMEGFEDPVSVYEGEVLIRGEIQAATDAAGKTEELEFLVKYQACNEKTCLPPKTLKLAGSIPIVKPGTPSKQINQKYFSEKK